MSDSDKSKIKWAPLEGNPEVFNQFYKELGGSESYEFVDVWGLEEDLLNFIPQPVKAVIFLFPVSETYEKFRLEEDKTLEGKESENNSKVFFMKQTVGNACGTVAFLHGLINNYETLELKSDILNKFIKDCEDLNSLERGNRLGEDSELAHIHSNIAQQGQTESMDPDSILDLHFLCFVEKDGEIYELDGRKRSAVNHGKCDELLRASVKEIKKFISRDSSQLNFSVVALTAKQS